MPTRLLPIDLLTTSYRIVGQLEVSSGGILGVLSDPNSSFMEVHDTSLARIHMATKLVEQAPLVRVVKQQVFAICLARREDVGPYAGMRSGYARTLKYPLRITTAVYEFDGTMEWPGRFDFVAIMAEGASDFFPIFDATLGAILFPSLLIQSPAMLINRKHVNTLVQVGEGI
jgi:hypothetical protein